MGRFELIMSNAQKLNEHYYSCEVRIPYALYSSLDNENVMHHERLFIDTVCPTIEEGHVLSLSAKIENVDSVDQFWSACLSVDVDVDILSTKRKVVEEAQIKEMYESINKDLQKARTMASRSLRAAYSESLEIPSNIQECFSLEKYCFRCKGKILLVRNADSVFYVHWHRRDD